MEHTSEISEALRQKKAILALESTILTHGLPWPQNLDFALTADHAIRQSGVIPAWIAVIDGKLKVGLSADALSFLCKAGPDLVKLSSFDLAWAQAKKLSGSTTVAGTMAIAAKAGIAVFATGAIGGVHRGVEESWDISHDLEALATHRMIVVSAGAKAILDLPKTLEYLETKGVLVIGWRSSEFPAFYYRNSGLPLLYRADTVQEITESFCLQTQGALLLANPIPPEFEIPKADIEPLILSALQEAKTQEISGKKLTPFLLNCLRLGTAERSVQANLALIRNNIDLGCQLAKALAAY